MSAYVLTAARNHGAFIDACIESVRAQTHTDWRMLVLDDGSSDDTVARVDAWCARDARIALHRAPSPPSGALGAYLQLLALVPPGHDVALLDGDDVWLPTHLAESLAALRPEAGTAAAPTTGSARPRLVHGDLALIDADGRELAPSLWRAAHLAPQPTSVRRLAIDNTVTGSTIAMNAALVAELCARAPQRSSATAAFDSSPISAAAPAPALYQDAWFALAAAALGQIVSRTAITVQYRQHTQNLVGASPRGAPRLSDLASPAQRAARATAAHSASASAPARDRLRRDLARSYAQAAAFLDAYGDVLQPDDRAFLARYAAIPQLSRPLRAWTL
ncbi:MAG TPA: glycosyltransferase, partial [Gemmatimonadaceae bacterium]|nr:glycosyltransferase [Gemmatimonadaceae bacterium]